MQTHYTTVRRDLYAERLFADFLIVLEAVAPLFSIRASSVASIKTR
jgi:hypothetical protein